MIFSVRRPLVLGLPSGEPFKKGDFFENVVPVIGSVFCRMNSEKDAAACMRHAAGSMNIVPSNVEALQEVSSRINALEVQLDFAQKEAFAEMQSGSNDFQKRQVLEQLQQEFKRVIDEWHAIKKDLIVHN